MKTVASSHDALYRAVSADPLVGCPIQRIALPPWVAATPFFKALFLVSSWMQQPEDIGPIGLGCLWFCHYNDIVEPPNLDGLYWAT